MSGAALSLKGWNVDALAASPDGALLVAGLSNFIGRHWTGAVAVLAAGEAGGAPALRELRELRAGVPAVALLPEADQFTGGGRSCGTWVGEGTHAWHALCLPDDAASGLAGPRAVLGVSHALPC